MRATPPHIPSPTPKSTQQTRIPHNLPSSQPDPDSPSSPPQPEQSTLELMIRAHSRIRTLEQDNEILRMHVDLLTKDNRELGQKAQLVENQRNLYQRQNEELANRLRSLEIKLEGFKVREQLVRIEKENITRNQITIIPKPNAGNYRIDKTQKQNEAQNHTKIHQTAISANEPKQAYDHTHSKTDNYFFTKSPLNRKQKMDYTFVDSLEDRRLGTDGLSRNQSCYLVKEIQGRGRFEGERKYEYRLFRNKSEPKQQSNDPQLYRKQQPRHESSHTALPKPSPSPQNHLQPRAASPQIRRNSPVTSKQKKTDCDFHPFRHSSSTSTNWGSTQGGLCKKFNYTSWRKTNNNMMVWKNSGGGAGGKAIFINR